MSVLSPSREAIVSPDNSPRSDLALRHLGLLVPWANAVMEHEVALLSHKSAAWHVSRMVPANRGTRIDESFFDGLHASIPDCLDQLSALTLEAVFLGCTSASFEEHVTVSSTRGTPQRVVTAFGALLHAIRLHGWTRVALVTPYLTAVTSAERDALETAGIRVLSADGLGMDDNFDQVPLAEVAALALATASRAADALIISCTNLNTLGLLATLEGQLGIPVLSSNRAIALMGDGTKLQ